jgi:hypothetical protein
MAEKKFFVDINLQGSALTNAKIGTNSAIGSTEGAFGYDSAAHRLQYFDGTAIKDVANLSDISAVTGGLIFQGGYDAGTGSPNITDDSSVLKGFFWVVTAAGSFLNEAVQVGDSIVAKQDNPGGDIANWLILQGNVVIATDSVDGISRLATQEEANDGTLGAAVVITPATLQGKIDAQITPALNDKLSKSGDTMNGTLNMGGNNIENATAVKTNELYSRNLDGTIDVFDDLLLQGATVKNVPTPTNDDEVANKEYVDGEVATALPLAGGTMSGSINMGYNSIDNVNQITLDYIAANSTDYVRFLGLGLDLNENQKVINLATPTADGDAANKLYVDGAASTAQANAETYADSLAPNYDPAGSATTAEQNAKDYADSLAPNYDPAGSASTAESNANTYTDTAIANTRFNQNIAIEDWTFNVLENAYYVQITHNLNSEFPIVLTYGADNKQVEMVNFAYSPNQTWLISNISPTYLIYVTIAK